MDTKPKKKLYKRWWFWVLALIALNIIAGQFFRLIYIKGASMEPTLKDGNMVLTEKFFIPKRGDMVVVNTGNNLTIKRVIALPNEKVKIKDGQVIIYNQENTNGLTLEEKYLPSGTITFGDKETTLDANQYYVLGDNRPNSLDSRIFGSLPRSDLEYKILFK